MSILVVEEITGNAASLARRLDGAGSVTPCVPSSLASFEAALQAVMPQLVVVAHPLPPASAGSAAAAGALAYVRAARQHDPDLPIVLVAKEGSEALAVAALRAGVTDYVTAAEVPQLAELAGTLLRGQAAAGAREDDSPAMPIPAGGLTELLSTVCTLVGAQAAQFWPVTTPQVPLSTVVPGGPARLDPQDAAHLPSYRATWLGEAAQGLRTRARDTRAPAYDNALSAPAAPDAAGSAAGCAAPEGSPAALTALLVAPVLSERQQPEGYLALWDKPGGFTPADSALATGSARLAAIALHSAGMTTVGILSVEPHGSQDLQDWPSGGLADLTPTGIALTDENGCIVLWNATQERLTGLTFALVAGRPLADFGDLFQPVSGAGASQGMAALMETGLRDGISVPSPENQRWALTNSAGGVRRVVVDLVCRPSGEGFAIGTVTRDATERDATDASHLRQQAILENLVEASRSAIAVVAGDGDTPGQFPLLLCNDTYRRMLRHSAAGMASDAHPADGDGDGDGDRAANGDRAADTTGAAPLSLWMPAEMARAVLERTLDSGVRQHLRHHRLGAAGHGPDGEAAVSHWDIEIVPFQAVAGGPPLALIMAHDVSGPVRDAAELARLAAATEQQRDLLHAIIETTDMQLTYLDRDLTIREVNAAAASAMESTREALIGTSVFAGAPESAARPILECARDTGETQHLEWQPGLFGNRPVRETGYWDWTVSPVTDREGTVNGLVLAAANVTERVKGRRKAERLAREAERQRRVLEGAIDNTDTGLAYLDASLTYLQANSAYARSFGLTPEEIVGFSAARLLPDNAAYEILRQARDTGEPVSYSERPFSWGDQPERGTRYLNWSVTPVRNSSGQVTGLVSYILDVTDQVRARQEIEQLASQLARRQTVLQATISSSTTGLAYLDATFTYVHVNMAYAAYSGRTPDEMIGQAHGALFSEPADLAAMEQVRESGQTFHRAENAYQPSGDPEAEPGYYSLTITPVQDGDGRVTALVVTTTDVTRVVQVHQHIERAAFEPWVARHLLRGPLDSAGVSLAYLNTHAIVLDANDAFVEASGLSRSDLIGANVLDMYGDPEVGAIFDSVLRTGTREQRSAYPFQDHADPEGDISYWSWSLAPVMDRTGAPEMLVLTMVDVTAEVRHRQEVERLAAEAEAQRDMMREILESTDISVAYLTPDLRYRQVNSAYARMFNTVPQEIVGQRRIDFFPGHDGHIEILERVLRTGTAETHTDLRVVFPDAPGWGESYIDWTITPVMDDNGTVVALATFMVNVTGRVQVRQEIEHLAAEAARQRDLLQVMIDSTETQIAYLDRNMNFVEVNAAYARASGMAVAGLIGRNHFSLFPDDRTQAIFERVRDTGEPAAELGTPFKLAGYPGEPAGHWDWTLTPLGETGGETTALVLSLTDVTERIEFSRYLEDLLAQREELVDVSRRVLADSDAPALLERVTRSVYHLTRADRAVAMHRHAGDPALVVTMTDSELEVIQGTPVSEQEAALWTRLQTTEQDLELVVNEADLRAYLDLTLPSTLPPEARLMGVRLVGAGGRTGSVLAIAREGGKRFSIDDQAAMMQIAALAALALDNIEARDEIESHSRMVETHSRQIEFRNEELARLAGSLQEEQALLSAVIRNAPMAIVATDHAGKILRSNEEAERLFPRTAPGQRALGDSTDTRLHWPDGRPCELEDLPITRAATLGVSSRDVEVVLTTAGGEQRNLLVHASPIARVTGDTQGAVGLIQDITARKAAERDLYERTRQAQLFNAVGRTLSQTLDRNEVFRHIVEAAAAFVQVDAVSIWLVDPDDANVLVRETPLQAPLAGAVPAGSVQDVGVQAQGSVAERARLAAEALHPMPARPRGEGDDDGPQVTLPANWDGIDIASEVALLHARGRVVGALQAARITGEPLNASHLSRLNALASWAAIAITNAELYAAAQEAAAAAERARLANDLHDAVSQLLFTARVTAESLLRMWESNPPAVQAGLHSLVRLTGGALSEMRSLLVELRPSALVETDLKDLLEHFARAITARSDLELTMDVRGGADLDADVRIALYRIAQEALNNVAKHARATRVTVTLVREADRVEVVIEDDGRGFETGTQAGGLGSHIMRERADSIGALLDVTSTPDRGTIVRVRWRQASGATA